MRGAAIVTLATAFSFLKKNSQRSAPRNLLINQSINQPFQSINQSVNQSINQSINLSNQWINQSMRPTHGISRMLIGAGRLAACSFLFSSNVSSVHSAEKCHNEIINVPQKKSVEKSGDLQRRYAVFRWRITEAPRIREARTGRANVAMCVPRSALRRTHAKQRHRL